MGTFLEKRPDLADGAKIKWSRGLVNSAARFAPLDRHDSGFRSAAYRPFCTQWGYFDRHVNDMVYKLPSTFPTPDHENIGFYMVGTGSSKPFSCLMTDLIPDLAFWGSGSGQFFSRWTYEKVEKSPEELDFAEDNQEEADEHGYRRVDNITDGILALYRDAVGERIGKDDIFFYVYGLLHDPDYRQKYAADLKKMLPRIPTPTSQDRFEQLADAGRRLADLHTGYENVDPYPLELQVKAGLSAEDRETWRMSKMKWAKTTDSETGKRVDDLTTIIYSPKVTITGIPVEAGKYMLGSRSALGWIIERYQVGTDKASGIVNDPNDWCDEHDNPRYIVDLIRRVTTVAIETIKIVDSLSANERAV